MAANPKQDAATAATAAIKKNGSGKQLANVPKTLVAENTTSIAKLFNAYRLQIASAIPKHIKPERMIQVVTTLVAKTPGLKECTTDSLIGGLLACSIFGLEPIPEFGQCYLIPFNNTKKNVKEAQFLIGYRGMIQLMLRNPIVKTVYVEAVYDGDEFEDVRGLNRNLVHRPCGEEDPAKITHVYAVLQTKNEGIIYVVMTRKQIEKVRDSSQAYKYAKKYGKPTMWDDHFEPMAKKTVIRQLFKLAPIATDVETAVGLDGRAIDKKAAQDQIQGEGIGLDAMLLDQDEIEEVDAVDVTSEAGDADGEETTTAQATQAQILTIRRLAKDRSLDEGTEHELSEFLKSDSKSARDADGWIAFLEKKQ